MMLMSQCVVAVCLVLVASGEAMAQGDRATPRAAEGVYVQAAVEAGNWIRSTAMKTQYGTTWPVAPDQGAAVERHLYSGSAGVILFFIELAEATGDDSWMNDARAGGDDLVAWHEAQADQSKLEKGLWTGLAGEAFALHRLYLATEDAKYMDAAQQMLRAIQTNPSGGAWSDTTDIISGSAGIGLFLMYAAEHMNADGALDRAVSAANDLVQRADAQPGGGLDWSMSPTYARRMPNFSHGTAGISFFLARLSKIAPGSPERGDQLLKAAIEGADHLKSIANTEDGGCLVFHHEPDGEDLYYLGWCHGPAGTSLLFRQLAQVTGDQSWLELVRAELRSLMNAGIPEQLTPGFWNNVGPCCGSAGVARFAIDMWRIDHDNKTLEFAQRLTEDLLARSTTVDLDGATGRKWIQAENRIQPDLLLAQTGYMQGAAGIGMWLLEMNAALNGEGPLLELPDAMSVQR